MGGQSPLHCMAKRSLAPYQDYAYYRQARRNLSLLHNMAKHGLVCNMDRASKRLDLEGSRARRSPSLYYCMAKSSLAKHQDQGKHRAGPGPSARLGAA